MVIVLLVAVIQVAGTGPEIWHQLQILTDNYLITGYLCIGWSSRKSTCLYNIIGPENGGFLSFFLRKTISIINIDLLNNVFKWSAQAILSFHERTVTSLCLTTDIWWKKLQYTMTLPDTCCQNTTKERTSKEDTSTRLFMAGKQIGAWYKQNGPINGSVTLTKGRWEKLLYI